MSSIADGWWNEDRRDLARSLEAIVSDSPDPDRIDLCLDTILNDLELYEDPRQGKGLWLYDNELPLGDRLGEQLHQAAAEGSLNQGKPDLTSGAWADVKATAAGLLRLMEANGDF